MLDLYYSSTSSLEFPIEKDQIGSFSESDFLLMSEIMESAREIGINFTPHSDFFISLDKAKTLLTMSIRIEEQLLEERKNVNFKFQKVLSNAIIKQTGVFFFCD